MAKIYATMVINGEKLWTEVNSLWRKKTCAEIEARGYICNPDGTASLPEPTPEAPDDTQTNETAEVE